VVSEKYHLLLTSRYVCEACLTRYFTAHGQCPACLRWGQIRPLTEGLVEVANTDEELREMIARGQRVVAEEPGTAEIDADELAALAAEALENLPPDWGGEGDGEEGPGKGV
jgi:predicted ATP-dependent serine protease